MLIYRTSFLTKTSFLPLGVVVYVQGDLLKQGTIPYTIDVELMEEKARGFEAKECFLKGSVGWRLLRWARVGGRGVIRNLNHEFPTEMRGLVQMFKTFKHVEMIQFLCFL